MMMTSRFLAAIAASCLMAVPFTAAQTPPSVSVEKSCFRKSDNITVNFDNVVGENIWIGLTKELPNQAAQDQNRLMDYKFTCGHLTTCNTWPSSGSVSFSTADLTDDSYRVIVSSPESNVMAQAISDVFQVDFSCTEIPPSNEIVAGSLWDFPGPNDQRGPCPFINTLANHGIVNRNGTFIDLFDMAARLEAVYNVAEEFLHHGPVQLAIDCNQTYLDANGIVRLDLEALFDDRCEEHEASMVRADSHFGFDKSKLVDDVLLNNLMRRNPRSSFLTRADVMEFQSDRIMESRIENPTTEFRPFDIENMGAQGIFLFLLSDDPTLETVDKARLYFFLLLEKLPDDFVPGALRDTPFNFLNPTDFVSPRFVESMNNVESMMHIPVNADRKPITSIGGRDERDGERKLFDWHF